EKDLFCTLDGKAKSYCTPESYNGQSPVLYRNRGDGTFEDVTRRAGLQDPTSKGLGVAMLDFDDDGWIDLFVANDTQPNKLYRNLGNGTFKDVATSAGVAFSEAGVAYADYDNDGDLDLLMTANTGAAVLLRNDGGNRNGALRVRTIGTTSNRDGIGARVDVTVAGGGRQRQVVKTGSSYCSQSELPLT